MCGHWWSFLHVGGCCVGWRPWLPGGTGLSCTFVFLRRVPCLHTPLCKGVVEDLGTQETLGDLSRPRVGSSSCRHRLEIVLTSWPPYQVPPKRGSSFVESPNLTRGSLVPQLPCLTGAGGVTRFVLWNLTCLSPVKCFWEEDHHRGAVCSQCITVRSP